MKHLFLPLILLLSPWPVRAQTQPASGPTSAPQTTPQRPDAPTPHGNAGPVAKVFHTLKLTYRDKQILTGIRDGLSSPESTGLYFMLAKVADLPEISPDRWSRFDAPAPDNLLRNPDRYRYQPLRLTVLVYGVQKLSVENGLLTTSPYWPVDKPVYAVYCTADDEDAPPLLLYAPQPPPGLGKPDEVTPDGQQIYLRGPRFRTLGVFFNIVRRQSRGSEDAPPQMTDYPFLLAWQFRRASLAEGYSWRHFSFAGLIAVGIALFVVGFIVLKRQLKKGKDREGGLFRNYKPLRDAEDDRPGQGPVDPDLVDAVRQKAPTDATSPQETSSHES